MKNRQKVKARGNPGGTRTHSHWEIQVLCMVYSHNVVPETVSPVVWTGVWIASN